MDGYLEARMSPRKRIALVAHDNKKAEMGEWARFNLDTLRKHVLLATSTTGRLLEGLGLTVQRLQSGPLGGDLQIAAGIAESRIDALIFFWDPLQPMPHDPDVKALLRVAVVWNVPLACNWSSADFLISSPLMREEYARLVPDYQEYLRRTIPNVDDEGWLFDARVRGTAPNGTPAGGIPASDAGSGGAGAGAPRPGPTR
jgi:methylglyoxal synthase